MKQYLLDIAPTDQATLLAAQALARRYGEKVNAFIVAHPKARDAEPTFSTQTNMTFARYQTRQLGELRLRFDGRNLAAISNRYVTLDQELPKDPVAEQMAAEAKDAVRKAQEERFNGKSSALGGS